MTYIAAHMAGTVWRVLIKVGKEVKAGQEVVILESMKMEIPIQAEKSGTVRTIVKQEGEFVNEGDILLELD